MEIKKIVKEGFRYKLFLDDETVINTYEEVIINCNLLFNKYVDLNIISKIHSQTSYYDIFYKVLKLIKKRYCSEYEIEKYLIKNGVLNYLEILHELKQKGFVNDERFARAYIMDKVNLSNEGKIKIKKELLNHRIDENIIDKYLNMVSDSDMKSKVDKLIIKKISANTKDTPYVLKQKIINYLINLGYDKYFIIERLENFTIENQNLEKEMDKIYEKLSLKYSDEALFRKLRQKFYSKGFGVEEINDYIEKKI